MAPSSSARFRSSNSWPVEMVVVPLTVTLAWDELPQPDRLDISPRTNVMAGRTAWRIRMRFASISARSRSRA
jgi:hypothetical protein